MKKRIITTITAVATLSIPLIANAADTNSTYIPFQDGTGYYIEDSLHMYPLTGIVTGVEYEAIPNNDLVFITCANGNEFSFYAPISEGWDIADLASCIMDSKGTDIVLDDEIILAQYAGGLNQFAEWID